MTVTGRLRPVRGARVRLLRDIETRGGVKFRAGVVMRLCSVDGGYLLECSVRAKHHYLRLQKKYASLDFEVVSVPDPEQERIES